MKQNWLPFWAVPILVFLGIGTVWLRLFMIRTSYSINQSENQIRELQQNRERLELKVAGLRSPRHLEILAKAKFGLSQPKSNQVVHLK